MIVCKIVITSGHCYVETHGHTLDDAKDDETLAEGIAVCSAVSALMQNLGYGLQAIALKHPNMVEITVSEWPEGAIKLVPADMPITFTVDEHGKWHTVKKNKPIRARSRSIKS